MSSPERDPKLARLISIHVAVTRILPKRAQPPTRQRARSPEPTQMRRSGRRVGIRYKWPGAEVHASRPEMMAPARVRFWELGRRSCSPACYPKRAHSPTRGRYGAYTPVGVSVLRVRPQRGASRPGMIARARLRSSGISKCTHEAWIVTPTAVNVRGNSRVGGV